MGLLNHLYNHSAYGVIDCELLDKILNGFRYEQSTDDKKSDEKMVVTAKDVLAQLFKCNQKTVTQLSARLVVWEVGIYCKSSTNPIPQVFIFFCFKAYFLLYLLV